MVIAWSADKVTLGGDKFRHLQEAPMTELLATVLAKIGANLLEALIMRLVQAIIAAAFRPRPIAIA
jgi:hypothetical protein